MGFLAQKLWHSLGIFQIRHAHADTVSHANGGIPRLWQRSDKEKRPPQRANSVYEKVSLIAGSMISLTDCPASEQLQSCMYTYSWYYRRRAKDCPVFHIQVDQYDLGNGKNALLGTFHAIRKMHVPRYPAEFEYRFNQRFNLASLIERLAYVALRTPQMPYRFFRMAEVYK